MPELPEVEYAARRLRAAIEGKTIARVKALHPALRRRLPPAHARRLSGATVVRVDRRGKHQVLRLADGASLHAHFRMAGDWAIGLVGDVLAPHARAVIELEDGTRVTLVDPRALSTLVWFAPGTDPLPALGPDANDAGFDARSLGQSLARRHGPIKPVLLDQGVVAGVGNIYASEALWQARISPLARASSISRGRLARLVDAIRMVLSAAERDPGRYSAGDVRTLNVYGREGEPCPRCGARIRRIVQAGRSTYYCSSCQRQ